MTSDIAALGRRSTMFRAVAFVGVGEVAAKVGLVVATLVVARTLGADAFGQWSYAAAMAGVIGLLAEAGLTNALQRRIARGDEDAANLISNALAMKLLAALAAIAVVAIIAVIGRKPGPVALSLLMLGVFSIANTSALMVQGVFRATASSHLDAVARIGQQIALVAAVLTLATMSAGVIAFSVGYAVTGAIGITISLLILHSHAVPVRMRFDFDVWRSLAQEAWPFWVAGILWIAYFRVDVVILSYLGTDRQAGLYNLAYNGFQVLTLPSAVLAGALYPSFAHLYKNDVPRFDLLRWRTHIACLVSGAAIAGAASLAVGPGIRLIAGTEYEGSVLLFRVLTLGLVFLYPNYLMFQTLSAAGRQRLVMLAAGVGAASNICLNLVLVPGLQALGASIATISTEAVVFCVLSVMAWRALGVTDGREKPVLIVVEPAGRELQVPDSQRAA
ncbi:MAG: flippase [Chloroflexi bacterium]|nr:flippase [Chloroflexota bacterium]